MLNANEIKPDTIFLYQNQPFLVLEAKQSHIGRGGAIYQIKMKNLKTNAVLRKNFKAGDSFEDADISRENIKYLYGHRGQYCFSQIDDTSKRFFLKDEQIGDIKKFLKANTKIEAIKLDNEIINIVLPIKVELKVVEAPPNFKGDTAEAGSKTVILETGKEVKAPMFIKEGDILRINTRTGEYVERAS